jgi:hypothetical protein
MDQNEVVINKNINNQAIYDKAKLLLWKSLNNRSVSTDNSQNSRTNNFRSLKSADIDIAKDLLNSNDITKSRDTSVSIESSKSKSTTSNTS